eukprot:Skav218866  [mRNA]  locus=scaffold2417:242354:249989:+ [translate_table: standard]
MEHLLTDLKSELPDEAAHLQAHHAYQCRQPILSNASVVKAADDLAALTGPNSEGPSPKPVDPVADILQRLQAKELTQDEALRLLNQAGSGRPTQPASVANKRDNPGNGADAEGQAAKKRKLAAPDQFIDCCKKIETKKNLKKNVVDEGWYTREEMARDSGEGFEDVSTDQLDKMNERIAARGSVTALETDLQSMDSEYNKLSDCMAKGAGPTAKRFAANVGEGVPELNAVAVESEFGKVAASKGGVTKWAHIGLTHSERDVQTLVEQQGTKLMLPIKTIVAEGVSIPWISPVDWLQHIVDNGLWHRLAGVDHEQRDLAPQVWKQFWAMHQKLCPEFSMYTDETLENIGSLCNIAGIYLHGDEGRTLKKNGLMVTTWQSCLGFGFREARMKRYEDGTLKLRCNYRGHTFTTRYIMSAIPKALYENDPKVYQSFMTIFSQQLQQCFLQGVYCKRTKQRYRICLLGVKGDWPFLQKCGSLNRAFNTGVKRGTRRSVPKGTCHLCLSGYNDQFPAEEICTSKPQWLQTVGLMDPWDSAPPLLQYLCFDRSHPGSFFLTDVWHVFHLGVGKAFVASTVQLCLQVMDGTLEHKWEWLTQHYLAFCKQQRTQPHITKVSQYIMSYGDKRGATGAWSKGALTTSFMKWLPHLVSQLPEDHQGVLKKCLHAACDMNTFFGFLFNAPAFLDRNEATYCSQKALSFLRIYGELARFCYDGGRPLLFPLLPKLHWLHHVALDLDLVAERVGYAMSPLVTACQQDEDCIGRCSRLSRRVSARATMERTLQRSSVLRRKRLRAMYSTPSTPAALPGATAGYAVAPASPFSSVAGSRH